MTKTKSDCGCGETARPSEAAHTTPVSGSTPTATAGSPTGLTGKVVLDGFRGLNARDGLFLRAEHLTLIQDYARSLTTALAPATGPGVVHGLGARLAGDGVEVSPGLAVSGHGRLLLLQSTAPLALDADHLPSRLPDGFWRVEINWAKGTSGSAPVYGSLCNDSCADGGATIEPLLDEGVAIRIVADSLPGLDSVPFARRHNWLASAYFERERAGGQPWLVPTGAGNPVSLWSHDWEDSTPLPQEAAVPLALLQSGEKATYDLDVWAARRLVDGSWANAAWRDRLAMRPWSVFLAQILQFEAQIAGLTVEGQQAAADVSLANYYQEATKDLLVEAQRFLTSLGDNDLFRKRKSFKSFEEAVHERAEHPLATAVPPPLATQLGMGELPPAGYLNVRGTQEDIEGDVHAFFGPSVDLHLRRLRADQVAGEVMAAQHRDRIPLEPAKGRRPQVDILVPAIPADRDEQFADAYGWVAFVRQGLVSDPPDPPAAETEEVEAYLLFDSHPERFSREFDEGDLKLAREITLGTLTYPKGGWAYPGGAVAQNALDTLHGVQPVSLVAITRGDDRPLAATRAGLFGTSLDSGQALPVFAHGRAVAEAVVVIAQTVIN